MDIILLEQVRKLGNVGDVVKVKNGYARNFLIPNKKALRASKDNIAYFETRKKEIQQANQGKVKEAEAVKQQVAGVIVPIIMQAAEDGRLYGSVTAATIAEAVSKKSGQPIDRKQVVLNRPIKYIGVHDQEIDLFADVVAIVHINVSRSESEAEEAEARFKRGEKVMEGPEGELHKRAEQAAQAEKPAAKKAKKEDAEADKEAGETAAAPEEDKAA